VYGHGYIICEEMRKKFRNPSERELKTHFIGGKVEPGEDPLFAACREFCEEYNHSRNFKFVYDYVKLAKHGSIDLTVSHTKDLQNRFYLVNVSSIPNEEVRRFFETAVDNFDRHNSELVSVSYWNGKSKLQNATSMVNDFIKKCKPANALTEMVTSNELVVIPELPVETVFESLKISSEESEQNITSEDLSDETSQDLKSGVEESVQNEVSSSRAEKLRLFVQKRIAEDLGAFEIGKHVDDSSKIKTIIL